MNEPSGFANWLKLEMEQRRARPAQIAAYAGVSRSSVTNWLRGGRPELQNIQTLAAVWRVDWREAAQAAGYTIDGRPEVGTPDGAVVLYATREKAPALRLLLESRRSKQHRSIEPCVPCANHPPG